MLVVALSLIVATSVPGTPIRMDPCDTASTTVAMEDCMKAQLRVADSTLRRLEDSIVHHLGPAATRGFRAASRSWMHYRDVQCTAVASRSAGGSIAPLDFGGCKILAAEDRIRFLRAAYSP